MRIVTTSYVNTSDYTDPLAWLDRIDFHTGSLEALAKKHEVHSIEQISYKGVVEKRGVQYHFLNCGKPKLYVPAKLHQYIKLLKPDVVWVHGLHFPFQLMQLKQALGNAVKIIVQNHAEKPQTGWRKWLQKKADQSVDAYLFTSYEMGKVWVEKGIISTEQKLVEVMEASSVFRMNRTTGDASRHQYLWVGRLDHNKDPLTAVKAFLRFGERYPEAKLSMIYHEENLLEAVKALLASHKNPSSIELIGKVPHKQLSPWFNQSDFIISASHYEGSGIAVCEAMSCGCIPILTNIDSFKKMTGNGSCGFLYASADEEALYKILLQSMTIQIAGEREKVLQQFEEQLSFKAIADRIDELITKLVQDQ